MPVGNIDPQSQSPVPDLSRASPIKIADTVPAAVDSPPADPKDVLPIRTASTEPHVLVTDDNAINRKASAWNVD